MLGRELLAASGDDKTAILVSAEQADGAGALYRLLLPLSEAGVNMTRIESRPSRRGVWDYVFFIDVDGHPSQAPVAEALATLEETASMCRVIWAYPRAVL